MATNEFPEPVEVTEEKATADLESKNSQGLPPQMDEPMLPTWRLAIICVCVALGLFLSLLDTTIVATALYSIGADFDAETSVTWVALAYTLSYVGCAVLCARLADVLGRRNAYVASFVIFGVFSIGCGFAKSLDQLIACRALQGVGGSGLYSLTFIVLAEVSPQRLTKFIGSFAGMVVATAGVLGPVLGGLITHYTTWRWIFWINAPIIFFPLILFCIAWPKSNQLRPVQRQFFRQLDIIGCILLIAASVLVVYSFQEAGINANFWGSAKFIAPLVVGCLCWVLLFAWEALVFRLWEESVASIWPLRLFKHRVFMAAMFSTMITGFPYFAIIYNLPIRLQVVNGKNQLESGVGLLPLLGTAAVGSMLGGFISSKKNRTWETLVAAACLMALGTGLLSTLGNTPEVEPKTYGFQVFVGLGLGLTVSTVSMLASIESEIRDQAVAQGIIAQSRVLGGSIGIAASTAILGVIERRQLTGIVSEAQLASLQSVAGRLSLLQLQAVRQAYSDSFSETLRVCAIIAAIGILVTLFTYQPERLEVMERRKQQIAQEMQRQRAVRARQQEMSNEKNSD